MFLTNKIIAISSVITTCPDFSFHVTVYYTFPCTYKQINFSLFNASCPEDCDFYLAVFILTSGKHVYMARAYDIRGNNNLSRVTDSWWKSPVR